MIEPDGGAAHRVLAYFDERKREIRADLESILAEAGGSLAGVSPLGADVCGLLAGFATAGKMIRGGLVCYAASRGAASTTTAVRVGAAMELFQSALLIHDDIMDRDTERRGQPSVHHHYARVAARDGAARPEHVGESLGICAGDIAFFLAFQALAELDLAGDLRARLVGLFARELSLVGVAQMMDMSAGASRDDPGADDVLRLYLYKTGRYTFSLPLLAGAILGGLGEEAATALDPIGEALGLLFQIKDDEIGLFGDPADTGKPVGSDIREGKKTIYYAYLVRDLEPATLGRVRGSWGRPGIEDSEVRFLLDAIVRHGARAEVEKLKTSLAGRALELSASHPFLGDLVAWSLERTR